MKELAKTDEGQARIAAAAARLDMTASELGQRHRAVLPKGQIAVAKPMEQHQFESSTFLPMTETETIKPPTCEFVEATSYHIDEACQTAIHGEPDHQ